MNQAKYIGKIEENTYGVPLAYQYADSFKMNQFVLYLIQNQEELARRFALEVSDEFASSYISTINNLDEFKVLRYLNLELFDASSLDLDRLELTLFMAGIGLRNNEKELFFSYPFDLDIYCEGELIDNSEIEKYRDKTVSISFDEDFPLLFETNAQKEKNQAFFKQILEPIFKGLGLSMRSSLNEIEARFGICN